MPSAPGAVATGAFRAGVPLGRQRRELAAVAAEARRCADEVDARGEFPQAALEAIRRSGLLGLMVPVEIGGLGGDCTDLVTAGRAIGAGCLSAALIWTMHCQQVAVLARYGSPRLRREVLPEIAAGDVYVASVTSEVGKGGELTAALAPLRCSGSKVLLERDAPVVTGGEYADGFLVTMRRDGQAQSNDVVLVYAHRSQLEVAVRSGWETMGVRGTRSGGMHLSGELPNWQVISPAEGFSPLAGTTMIPVGHVAWASSWLGAAEGALREVVAAMKDPKRRKRLRPMDELVAERLARVRISIDLAESFLRGYARDYEEVVARAGLQSPVLRSAAFNIRTNNLKVAVSELAFEAVDELVKLTGLGGGYRQGGDLPVERSFRDLRSGALMYSNDRLLTASGKLALFDGSVEPFVTALHAGEAGPP